MYIQVRVHASVCGNLVGEQERDTLQRTHPYIHPQTKKYILDIMERDQDSWGPNAAVCYDYVKDGPGLHIAAANAFTIAEAFQRGWDENCYVPPFWEGEDPDGDVSGQTWWEATGEDLSQIEFTMRGGKSTIAFNPDFTWCDSCTYDPDPATFVQGRSCLQGLSAGLSQWCLCNWEPLTVPKEKRVRRQVQKYWKSGCFWSRPTEALVAAPQMYNLTFSLSLLCALGEEITATTFTRRLVGDANDDGLLDEEEFLAQYQWLEKIKVSSTHLHASCSFFIHACTSVYDNLYLDMCAHTCSFLRLSMRFRRYFCSLYSHRYSMLIHKQIPPLLIYLHACRMITRVSVCVHDHSHALSLSPRPRSPLHTTLDIQTHARNLSMYTGCEMVQRRPLSAVELRVDPTSVPQ